MYLDSSENDLEIFGFFLNFNIDFSTLFKITLLDVFLSSFRCEKIEKKFEVEIKSGRGLNIFSFSQRYFHPD
jgi:hypothetical protein